jgi:hypothetical protein
MAHKGILNGLLYTKGYMILIDMLRADAILIIKPDTDVIKTRMY